MSGTADAQDANAYHKFYLQDTPTRPLHALLGKTMRRISEAQLVVILQMQEGWKLRRVYDFVSLETNNSTWNIHRNTFNALFDKGLIELKYKEDESRRTFCLTKRAADLPLVVWKNYYLAKAANR